MADFSANVYGHTTGQYMNQLSEAPRCAHIIAWLLEISHHASPEQLSAKCYDVNLWNDLSCSRHMMKWEHMRWTALHLCTEPCSSI